MEPNQNDNLKYKKIAITAIVVVFVSILLVVIFTNLPGFFAMLHQLGNILSPLIFGIVIAFLLNPLVRFFERWVKPQLQKNKKLKQETVNKLSRAGGCLFALIIAALIIYAFCAMLLPQIYDSLKRIVENANDYYRSIETWVTNLLEDNDQISSYVETGIKKVYDFVNNWIETTFFSDVQKLLTTLTSSVISVVSSFANFFIGLVAAIYILYSKDSFQTYAKKITVALFQKGAANHLFKLGRRINRTFNGFLIGKIIDSMIIGVLCYIGCLIFRMPFPALLATVIGVTNIIPFFGPAIGLIPTAFLVLLINPLQALYYLIFVLILQQIDGNVIGPKILGNTVGISGFWVLVSITVAAGLFGFAGMILGVPVFAVLSEEAKDLINFLLRKKQHTTLSEPYYAIKKVEDLEQPAQEETASEAEQTPTT